MAASHDTEVAERPELPAGDEAAGEGARAWLRRVAHEYGPALAVFGAVRLIAFTVFMWLLAWSGDYLTNPTRFGGGAHTWDVLGGWDGWWYQQVAQNGYDPKLLPSTSGPWTLEQNSVAFFPLYPGLMKMVSAVTGLGTFGAGVLVSVVSSFVAAAGIYAVAKLLAGRRAAVIAAGVWGVFPGSGVEWAVYSDSLFVALAAWACYFVLTRNWLAAGVTSFVAGLNRPTSAALAAAVGVAALIALWKRRDGVLGPVSALLIAPLGFVGYIAWASWRMGSWTSYFDLQRGAWLHYFDWGKHTGNVIQNLLFGHHKYMFGYPTEDLIALFLVFALPILLFLLVRMRPPVFLLVYVGITVVLVLGSQQIFGNTSRYLLPCFPLFLPIAAGLNRLSRASLAAVLGITAVASGWYAGYVLFELGIP
ncbi:glycosyltransferase family 39 protein [Streptomyces sp. TLI_171]|uniref:glycosyltransferase family 39 protein n=1 Tax=Streptomyces sp. TLI_171 TaxID=1938859 RepID=UPI000C3B4ACC|nr:glycosyltransferase family 39 protein [Streptomyces sp. TLI_171]RKE20349.1 dolichyl-phosphate-mannose-protein mannosyltransferase [Streptomyces sp. TLI_171]